ncbi:MAG: YXWGXW repeat-containing protein [Thermoanaerobaculia bacterium]
MNQKHFSGLKLPAAALFAGAILTACVSAPPRGAVFVRTRPPAAIVEVRGVTPGPDHHWIAGHHEWRGGDYVWVLGHWDRGPHPRATWVNGQWKQHRDGWYWVDGHWK